MRRDRLASAVFGLAVVVPFLALVVQAFADRWHSGVLIPQDIGWRGVRAVWNDPTMVEAVTGSLFVGTVVAVLAVPIAWPAARFLADSGSKAGWALLAAPVLLPPLVLGDGLATWLLRLGMGDGRVGVIVAHLAIAIPYAVLALVPAFGIELRELEQSAALVGARPWSRLADVVLPAAGHHLALAAALAFTVSWSQYATSLAVGGGTPMLPLVLVPFVRSDPQIGATLALVFVVPPLVALGAAARLGVHRRNPGRFASVDAAVAATATVPTRGTPGRSAGQSR